MPSEIIMPKLGLTMTEGLIVEWKKAEGDPIKKGEILFILETEKVTYEVESSEDGILGKIHVQAGETVPVGVPVAHLLKQGEDASVLEEAISSLKKMRTATEPMEAKAASMEGDLSIGRTDMRKEGRAKASPLAKRAAREQNIDLQTVIGTGPDGMIIKEDVDKTSQTGVQAISSAPLPPDVLKEGELVPHSGMRLAIARNMMASKVQTAQTYMSNTVDAGENRSIPQENASENSGLTRCEDHHHRSHDEGHRCSYCRTSCHKHDVDRSGHPLYGGCAYGYGHGPGRWTHRPCDP